MKPHIEIFEIVGASDAQRAEDAGWYYAIGDHDPQGPYASRDAAVVALQVGAFA
jgi:hypothetical protein